MADPDELSRLIANSPYTGRRERRTITLTGSSLGHLRDIVRRRLCRDDECEYCDEIAHALDLLTPLDHLRRAGDRLAAALRDGDQAAARTAAQGWEQLRRDE